MTLLVVQLNAQREPDHQCTTHLYEPHDFTPASERFTRPDHSIALVPKVLSNNQRSFKVVVDVGDNGPTIDAIRYEHCSNTSFEDCFVMDGLPFDSLVLKDDGIFPDEIASDSRFTSPLISFTCNIPIDAKSYAFKVCSGLGYRNGIQTGDRFFKGYLAARVYYDELPSVRIDSLSPTVYTTDHVVNIVQPLTKAEIPRERDLYRQLYEVLPDSFDFVTFLHAFGLPGQGRNGSVSHVSNAVFGVTDRDNIFDNSADYFSQGRLKSIISLYPYIEPDGKTFLHELNHIYGGQNADNLFLGDSHYEGSDFVREGTGFQDWPIRNIIPISQDTFQIDFAPTSKVIYSNYELYQMGLLPIDSVAWPIKAILNPEYFEFDKCTVDSLIYIEKDTMLLAHGARVPAYGDAPSTWKVLFVVASEKPLSATEMSWFNEISKAAMTENNRSPFAVHTFFESTGGRGRLDTRINLPVSKVNDDHENKLITLYPNPSKEMVYIKGIDARSTPDIRIFNIQGNLIQNSNGKKVDISHLIPGQYVVQITLNGQLFTRTLIK